MSEPTEGLNVGQGLRAARNLAQSGRPMEAITLLHQLQQLPAAGPEVAIALARIANEAGDTAAACRSLDTALAIRPDNELLAVELAVTLAGADNLGQAVQTLRRLVDRAPQSPLAWLVLGQLHEDRGDVTQSLLARFESLAQAQAAGVWRNPQSTPDHLIDPIRSAVHALRTRRREVFSHLMQPLRDRHGGSALARIDGAIKGYLGEVDATPADPMQRPRFIYIPGLPSQPFMEPMLHDWAPRLRAAFDDIRGEAVALATEVHPLEPFVEVRTGDRIENYLGGLQPSWDAFFFYRHGQRYQENHLRCPRTSAVLESLDLVRIPGQTPEVCFSVLAPGTHILPHHGVTNARAVMHLPLIVPPDCALNLVQRGTHPWKEGELVMFDDTFLHEAWNRSDSVRIILLMDCWNPHLQAPEREAVMRLSVAIGVLDVALGRDGWPEG
jgi:aspartate beta-hydroxylase